MRTEEIYHWLAEFLHEEGDLDRSTVHETLGNRAEDALFFLEFLVARGVLKSQRQGTATVYTLVDPDSLDDLLGAYTDEEETTATETRDDGGLPTENQLVVSTPLDMQPELERLRDDHPEVSVLSLRQATKHLLRSADSKVLLSVPFFEQSGLNALLDEVTALARAGVDLQVLTRDVKSGDGYNHTNKCRALAKLCDLYTANQQVAGTLEIRDFGDRISGHPKNPSRHYRGVHQKMVVVDDTAAYVGSGEIRENSFLANGEAGTLTVSRSEVSFWSDFFNLFWEQATPVEKFVEEARYRR